MIIGISDFISMDTSYYESTYKQLCPSGDGGYKKKEVLFKSYADLFTFACILGMIANEKEPIEKRRNEIRWGSIKDSSKGRLIALSVARHGDVSIMKDPKMLKDDLEQRANHGMKIINEKISLSGVDYKTFSLFLNDIMQPREINF